MSNGWKLYWVLVVATFALMYTMTSWSLAFVSEAAGGLVPFDLRPSGYSFDDAHTFLAAITTEGRDFYLDTQHTLDFAYPGMLGAVLVIALWYLTSNLPKLVRYVVIAFPIVGSSADYFENAAVAQMLRAGVDGLTVEMVEISNYWTVAKSAMTSVGMVILLVLLAIKLVRRYFVRNATE